MEQLTGKVEADWSWKRKHLQGKTKIVNLYYRKQILQSIKDTLRREGDDSLLKRFEEGCFGHLLGWKCGTSNCQALNALISRQIISPALPDHELWFRINETNIRFSFPEFALVTGLHFGTSEFNQSLQNRRASDVGVFQRFCRGFEMDLDALWYLFDKGPRPSEATEEDYLKVANVLVLYLFVLGNEVRRKPDNFAWVLVDNLSAWNKFPWGGYCFKAFLHHFNQMKTSKGKYHFFGTAWSLQIWALEAIPSLGGEVGKLVARDALPRCLKWAFKKSKLLDFHSHLDTVRECHKELEASPAEKLQGYWTSSEDLSWLNVGYVEPFNTLNLPAKFACLDRNKRKGKRKVLSDGDESDHNASAGNRKRRRDETTHSFSASNHICQISGDRIVEKLVARVVPKLVDYLKKNLVPEMIATMKSLVAQRLSQTQTRQQSPLILECGDDPSEPQQPNPPQQLPVKGDVRHQLNPTPKPTVNGDEMQHKKQSSITSNHDDIVGDEHCQTKQLNPPLKPTVNGDEMQHQQESFLPPDPDKIVGDDQRQLEQPNHPTQTQLHDDDPLGCNDAIVQEDKVDAHNIGTEKPSEPLSPNSPADLNTLVKDVCEDAGISNEVEVRGAKLRRAKRTKKKRRMHPRTGSRHQACLPELVAGDYESDPKWLSTKIWPLDISEQKKKITLIERDRVGKGRQESCGCQFTGSAECVRFHVREKRLKLKLELGTAFYSWKFDVMGEDLAFSWTKEDQMKFQHLVQTNPLDELFKHFPNKGREALVSYYFNVFLLQRRGIQNRTCPSNIHSDDEDS